MKSNNALSGEARKIIDDTIIKQAKRIIRSGEQHMPMFFIKSKKGIAVVGTPFNDSDSKDMATAGIRMLCESSDADFFIFVTEGWARQVDDPKKWDGVMPSQSPDRKEVLLIMVNLRDGTVFQRSFGIKRSGSKVSFADLGETSICESRFAMSW